MANKYRWSFDGAFVSEPTNALGMVDTINYDEKLKFIYWEKANSFNFIGDAYDYLYSKYTEGFCNEVAVQIDEDCDLDGEFAPYFTGIIKIRDCRFEKIGTTNCTVRVQVNDNNYFSLINNNATIQYIFNIAKSKNNEVIPVAGTFNVAIENPCTFASTYNRQLYKVDKCLKEIIAHITDNRVGYSSPFFGTGGAKEYLMCGSGYQFRVDGWFSLYPLLGMKDSYENLFIALDKQFNLGIYVDDSTSPPTLVIDKYDNLFATSTSISITAPSVLKLSTFVEKLYNKVKLGGETFPRFDCPDDGDFPTETPFYGFLREEFTLLSQCNIQKELNLENTYITDHNILYQVIAKGDTLWDTSIFLLDCYNNAGTIEPKLNDIFSNTKYYWNEDLRNINVAARWESQIPSSMAGYYQNTNYRFLAYRQGLPGLPGYVPFSNPDTTIANLDYPLISPTGVVYGGFDPDNIYGNGTAQGFNVMNPNCKFVAPVDGYYYLKVQVTDSIHDAVFHFRVTDSVGVDRYTLDKLPDYYTFVGITAVASTAVYMLAGDFCFPYVTKSTGFAQYLNQGFSVELFSSPTISGITQSVDQGDSKVLKIEVESYLKKSDYATMKTNFKNFIEIFTATKIFRGYLYSSKYEETTGKAQLTLITSNNFIDGRN